MPYTRRKKPDAPDNIAKIICDALNNIAYGDDTQVIELTVVKKYAKRAESQGINLRVLIGRYHNVKRIFPHDYGARLSLRGIRKRLRLARAWLLLVFLSRYCTRRAVTSRKAISTISPMTCKSRPRLCYAVTHNFDLFTVKKGKIVFRSRFS